MPDVFVYAGYLAALTKRIKIGTAVVTLPLANPVRVAENSAFLDILSGGRFVLGLGSGYRQYEFDGFGIDFEAAATSRRRRSRSCSTCSRRSAPIIAASISTSRSTATTRCFRTRVQEPHPPIFLAGATDRSIGVAGAHGLRPVALDHGRRSTGSRARSRITAASSNTRRRSCARTPRAAMPT